MKHSTYEENDVVERCGNCNHCQVSSVASSSGNRIEYFCENPTTKYSNVFENVVNPSFGVCGLFEAID